MMCFLNEDEILSFISFAHHLNDGNAYNEKADTNIAVCIGFV